MTDILDVVCKGSVIIGPAYETPDVICKGTVVVGPLARFGAGARR